MARVCALCFLCFTILALPLQACAPLVSLVSCAHSSLSTCGLGFGVYISGEGFAAGTYKPPTPLLCKLTYQHTPRSPTLPSLALPPLFNHYHSRCAMFIPQFYLVLHRTGCPTHLCNLQRRPQPPPPSGSRSARHVCSVCVFFLFSYSSVFVSSSSMADKYRPCPIQGESVGRCDDGSFFFIFTCTPHHHHTVVCSRTRLNCAKKK